MLWTRVALSGLARKLYPALGPTCAATQKVFKSRGRGCFAQAGSQPLVRSLCLTRGSVRGTTRDAQRAATMDCEPQPVGKELDCATPGHSGGNGSTLSSSHHPHATSGGSHGGSSSGTCVGAAALPTREMLEDRGGYLMRVLALLVADGSLAVRAHPLI